MTEEEIKAVADELASRTKAAATERFAKVKSFVLHNLTGILVGGAAVFMLLKVL